MNLTDGKSIVAEEYREYEFDGANGRVVVRIERPKLLFVGTTTHRVLDDAGVVHCVPTVGERGCVLRWKPKDLTQPIQF